MSFLLPTCLISWALIMVFIVRWFQFVSGANEDWETTTEFIFDLRSPAHAVSEPLASH
jgi:hypothetical protein